MNKLKYHEVINWFISNLGFNSYLELGLRDINATFNNVNCSYKESVDCNPCGATFTMTTDQYFAGPGNEKSFDVYFLDASHFYPNVKADVENIFSRWKDDSILIMDDINPEEKWLEDEKFCGTAWRVWAELRKRSDLTMHAFKGTRFGFVKKGSQDPLTKTIVPTFEFLSKNREEIMKLIDFHDLSRYIK